MYDIKQLKALQTNTHTLTYLQTVPQPCPCGAVLCSVKCIMYATLHLFVFALSKNKSRKMQQHLV